MRRSTLSILLLTAIVSCATMFPEPTQSQSGRGRPRVPAPAPSAPKPTPVTVPAAAVVVKQEQFGNVSKFLLRNGITVIISEQHAAPIAASVACFKVGRRNDPQGLAGITRLIDRLRVSGRNRAAQFRELGALTDSSTSFETTAHSVVVTSDKIAQAMAIQAALIGNLSFETGQLQRAAGYLAIEDESTGGLSSDALGILGERAGFGQVKHRPADSYSLAQLLKNTFKEDNSAGELAVNVERLRSITPQQAEMFYREHYRPENLVVVVAGDVVPFPTLVQVQQLYGGFGVQAGPANPTRSSEPRSKQSGSKLLKPAVVLSSPKDVTTLQSPPTASSAPAAEPALRYQSNRRDVRQSIVTIGYRVPGPESKDWAAFEVLAAIAGAGRASRLNRSLVDLLMAASRVESAYLARTNGSLIVFQLWPAGDSSGESMDKAESAFFREIDRLRRDVPDEAEIARATALLEKRLVDRSEDYAGRALELARSEVVFGNYRAVLEYRNAIRAVKGEDVQRAAARYFVLSNTSVHEQEPATAPPRTFDAASFAATVLAWAPEIASPVTSAIQKSDPGSSTRISRGLERSAQQLAELESIQPLAVRDFSTLNGPKAFVREDRSLPKVTVGLLFQGGRLIEEENTSGITELMLRSMLYGTPRKAGLDLWQELEQLGAEIEPVVETDFFGFVLSVLSRNAEGALKLLRDCIEEPAFRDEDVQRSRVAQIGAIRRAHDSTLDRSRELLFRALYSDMAYSLPVHGRENVVGKLLLEQLRDWHDRTVKRQHPLAIIIGDTQGSALVSSQVAEAFRRRELDTGIKVKLPRAAAPANPVEPLGRSLSVVTIGWLGPRGSSNDWLSIELIEAAVTGPGGQLDSVLEGGLAICDGLQSEKAFASGTIYAQFIAPPENEPRARNGLLAVLERLQKSGLSNEEILAARAVAAGAKSVDLQSQRNRALEYARAVFLQQQATEVDSFAARLLRVTNDDVKRVVSAYLKPNLASTAVLRASPSQPTPQPRQD